MGADGRATPMMDGGATPLLEGGATPSSLQTGMRSISGISSVTSGISGFQTPGTMSRTGQSSRAGISSASLTPSGPQLFQVLEEQSAGMVAELAEQRRTS